MWILDYLFGKPLASHEEKHQKVGVFAGLPMLGLDGLASAAYGPEAALTLLIAVGPGAPRFAMPIVGIILAILFVLYLSYRQTIAAYPTGGGSYTVAQENLGTFAGLVAAASLMLDYVLVVAVGISAGVGALVSAAPSLHPHILPLGLGILLFVTLVNLRGVRESGLAFAIPTYLFIFTLGAVLVIGIYKAIQGGGSPVPVVPPPALPAATATVSLWLLMRSFASGCTAMTGVEAVSNGVNAFAAPTVKNAQKTLTAIVGILALFLAGIAYLCQAYHIGATPPEEAGYQSVISQLAAAIVGKGFFYYLTIGCTLAVLALSANTGFADFPRLCRLVAEDDFLPHAFANRGRRLVYSLGISILAALAAILLIAFGGLTDRLIPLFAVGAFLAFTLSQAGMVVHWMRLREGNWRLSAIVNGLGAVATAVALIVVLVAKFAEGAWITCLIIPVFVITFVRVKKHYLHVSREIRTNAPIDFGDIQPPIVIVPIKTLTTITAKALKLALSISDHVIAMHISTSEEESNQLKEKWARIVGDPACNRGLQQPQLVIVSSPYRRLFGPLLNFVHQCRTEYPERQVAIVIPELVESRWYQYLLHNQRATGLKAALLLRGGRNVVVINVPWYLGQADPRD